METTAAWKINNTREGRGKREVLIGGQEENGAPETNRFSRRAATNDCFHYFSIGFLIIIF